MSTVEEIESAVEKLNKEELTSFRNWFAQHDAAQWDAQFESDVASGKLDSLAAEAIAEFEPLNYEASRVCKVLDSLSCITARRSENRR